MDYLTAKNSGLIKSGSVVAFKNTKNMFDKWIQFWAGPYYHCGILYVDPATKNVMIYETSYNDGIQLVKFGGGFIPFDIIDTGIDFNAAVKAFADAQMGKRYSWFNFGLVMFKLNSTRLGYICSTFVGEVLTAASDKVDLTGLTPSALVLELVSRRCPLVTIDSFGPPVT